MGGYRLNIRSYGDIPIRVETVFLAIGNFDGVHEGHRRVLTQAKVHAQNLHVKFVVVTFEKTPAILLRRDDYGGDIDDLSEKLKKFEDIGADEVVLLPGTTDFMAVEAESFIESLRQMYDIKGIVVGENFSFGRKGRGDIYFLKNYLDGTGIYVQGIPLAVDNKEKRIVSSSWIRERIRQGDVAKAAMLLGRYWSIGGVVMHGDARGKMLGFPTANLALQEGRVAPPNGVYATMVSYDGKWYRGITNVGINPTFGANPKRIETYIYDFSKDIYGEEIRVYFIQYIRPETVFSGKEMLQRQIQSDIVQGKKILRECLEIDKCT